MAAPGVLARWLSSGKDAGGLCSCGARVQRPDPRCPLLRLLPSPSLPLSLVPGVLLAGTATSEGKQPEPGVCTSAPAGFPFRPGQTDPGPSGDGHPGAGPQKELSWSCPCSIRACRGTGHSRARARLPLRCPARPLHPSPPRGHAAREGVTAPGTTGALGLTPLLEALPLSEKSRMWRKAGEGFSFWFLEAELLGAAKG